ncbi:hypothetical protein ACVWXU_004525 [Streptomyces sp. TE33382]
MSLRILLVLLLEIVLTVLLEAAPGRAALRL